jgi:peptide/nickel transport system permease protein
MIRFALTKFLGFVATFFVAAAIIFFTLDVLPGDPARFILGINATPDAVAALREQLGLDAPSWQRFFGWLGGIFVGNFGPSIAIGQPVGALVAGALGVTIPLTLMAIVLSAGIGLAIGIIAARRRGSILDTATSVLVRIGVAVPNFWFGMLLVLLFAVTLRWLPPGGFVPWGENPLGAIASLILPAIALALPQAAVLAQVMRTALLDVQASDYIRTARSMGMTTQEAIRRHGFRNALLPVLTVLGLQFAWLIAGTVIVENVFYLPGLGRLIFDAVSAHDLILVRGGLAVLVLAMTGTTFLADLGYALVDPRLSSRRTA